MPLCSVVMAFISLFTSRVPLPAFQTQLLQGEESVHAFMQWALFKMARVKWIAAHLRSTIMSEPYFTVVVSCCLLLRTPLYSYSNFFFLNRELLPVVLVN